ncbi:Glycerophosphodiester phosphodiesterase GDPDL4-like protein [Drosera capensis]
MSTVVALLFLHLAVSVLAAEGKSPWKTLDGNEPLVVARGGFSGMFPDSSIPAFILAVQLSVSNVILWCDVQLTKDGVGVCFPDLTMENSSSLLAVEKLKQNTYDVNGAPVSGHFFIDATFDDLANVPLIRGIASRTIVFDRLYPIMTVGAVFKEAMPPGFWLNIEHAAFYSQHHLSMRSFVLAASKSLVISHISSPEVKFLQDIAKQFAATKIKLIFRFMSIDAIEPSTNQSYFSLLSNLTFIKTFASGILVPKNYIWPVDESLYLEPHTSIVSDAHKAGLQIFAKDFANDFIFAYNYSYNPVMEYLSFIDNGEFCVDGVLTDFPITPSEAIVCFAHIGKNATGQATPLIISHNGASGDYPGCTDVAYTNAITDGADIIDCNVQISNDKVPFCLSSIDLTQSTTIVQTVYNDLTSNIPQLQSHTGIFSFRLNWSQIQALKPQISNPFPDYTVVRNPKYKNAGKLISLLDFLTLAQKSTSLSGVLISVENAFYLAEKQGLSVTDAVLDALNKAGYNNKTTKKVMIQSSDSSVLTKFKRRNFELVYNIDEKISDILNSTAEDIKKFADSVLVTKKSVYATDTTGFMVRGTNIVPLLQSFGFQVYVQVFRNEFVSQDWDFFADPIVEINEFAYAAGVNGIVTEFPQTAALYRKSRCLTMKNPPVFAGAVPPGGLLSVLNPASLPPVGAPAPILTVSDVSEPALSPVTEIVEAPTASSPKKASSSHPLTNSLSWLTLVAAGLFLL